MMYSREIFRDSGMESEKIQFAVIGISAMNMTMTVIAAFIMNRVGRRKLLCIAMTVMILAFSLLTVTTVYTPSIRELSYLSIACMTACVMASAVGLGPIPGIITSEIFPQV
jgi:SP family sugar:H+ symporter-like MFS transporter